MQYPELDGAEPKAVDGGGIGIMELGKMVYEVEKREVGNGSDYVKP